MNNAFWACLIIGNIWAANSNDKHGAAWFWYGLSVLAMVLDLSAK